MQQIAGKSLTGAVMRLFPEIGLEETKFQIVRREYTQNKKPIQQIIYNIGGYWNDVKNCRNSFLAFAQNHNFDPLVADNWYNTNMNLFKGTQGV